MFPEFIESSLNNVGTKIIDPVLCIKRFNLVEPWFNSGWNKVQGISIK